MATDTLNNSNETKQKKNKHKSARSRCFSEGQHSKTQLEKVRMRCSGPSGRVNKKICSKYNLEPGFGVADFTHPPSIMGFNRP